MNFLRMLRELEAMKPTQAELQKAAELLRRAGYKVEKPDSWNGGRVVAPPQPSPFTRRQPTPGQLTPLPLPGWENRPRQPQPDEDLDGRMTEVESSNVHSIGMRTEKLGDRTGTLLVRYLGVHKGGIRAGIGSLYGYYKVPVTLFREFQTAASKGKFVWDELRVRGTISGHKYAYELIGITGQFVGGRQIESYVPRQAALRRGQAGEHFITRTFREGRLVAPGRFGTVKVQSQLPPGMASMRGPNPTRGPGPDSMRFFGNGG